MRWNPRFVIGTAVAVPTVMLAAWVVVACSSDNGTNPNTHGACTSDGGTAALAGSGFSTKSFTAPCDPGAGGILFSASGEVLSLGGFKFPPNDPANDTYMV